MDFGVFLGIVVTVFTAVTAAATYGYWQEAWRTSRLQAMATIYEQWGRQDVRDGRSALLADDVTAELLAEPSNHSDEFKVAEVCAACNRIGFLAEARIVSDRLLLEFMGESYGKLWKKLSSHVYRQRSHTPTYMHSFEHLGKKAVSMFGLGGDGGDQRSEAAQAGTQGD